MRVLTVAVRVSIFLPLFLFAAAPAAELRTTAAGQEIHRTVGFEISDSGSKQVLIEPSMESISDPGCAACGTSGCNLGCLQIAPRWADFDYLLWWRRGNSLPPLATTSPNGTGLNQAGVLGAPGTQVLFGNSTYGEDANPGGRITLGAWLDGCHCNAWEARFFALGQETINFNVTSNGDPILARPLNNRDLNLGPIGNTSRPLAFPGIATNGVVAVRGESEIYGGDIILRHRLVDTGCVQLDVLGGYQYSRINESLIISDSFVDIDPNNLVVDGTQQEIVDRFETENQFHGGLLGVEANFVRECWRLELLARFAFGNMRQMVNILGQTTNTVPNDPNGPAVIAGGLLANSGNQGSRERDKFSVAPELGAKLVYDLSECVELSMGYSFIYWTNVAQPGHQIDPDLFVPSRLVFNDNPYWVHGLNAGINFRF